MKKSILGLGKVLNKVEQKSIHGGEYPCSQCSDGHWCTGDGHCGVEVHDETDPNTIYFSQEAPREREEAVGYGGFR